MGRHLGSSTGVGIKPFSEVHALHFSERLIGSQVIACEVAAKVRLMASDIQSLRRSRLKAWVTAHGGHANVVRDRKLNASQASFLSQVINGYSFAERAARAMEVRLGMPSDFLDTAQPLEPGVSHTMRQLASETPPIIKWESLLTAPLPPAFWIDAPDDSMLPRIAAGERVLFSSVRAAAPGDEVLLCDAAGNVYIRVYRQKMPTTWTAFAENPAYLPLESDRDGLTVLGVMIEHIRKRR